MLVRDEVVRVLSGICNRGSSTALEGFKLAFKDRWVLCELFVERKKN